jgi:hypothetical protein
MVPTGVAIESEDAVAQPVAVPSITVKSGRNRSARALLGFVCQLEVRFSGRGVDVMMQEKRIEVGKFEKADLISN